MSSAELSAEERGPREEATFTKKASAEKASADNRRIHSRYSVDLDVTLESDHNFYAGFAENISTGGVFIATHVMKPIGEKMEFSITLPGSTTPIKGIGEVRWVRTYSERSHTPPGLGLRFVQLPPGAAEAIEGFLRDREPLFYDDE